MKRSRPSLLPRAALGLLAFWAAACVGTPTPEPPDFLPLDGSLVNTTPVVVAEGPPTSVTPVKLAGEPGAVRSGTRVWLVNLDRPDVAPVEVAAAKDGSFLAEIVGDAGNRVRVVSRSSTQHSLPLDFAIIFANQQLTLTPLGDTSASCVEVLPAGELSLAEGDEQTFEITNNCADALSLERVALRFGNQGFSLRDTAKTIAPGDSANARVAFGPASTAERAEILLIDVVAGKVSGRYALGLWGR